MYHMEFQIENEEWQKYRNLRLINSWKILQGAWWPIKDKQRFAISQKAYRLE